MMSEKAAKMIIHARNQCLAAQFILSRRAKFLCFIKTFIVSNISVKLPVKND